MLQLHLVSLKKLDFFKFCGLLRISELYFSAQELVKHFLIHVKLLKAHNDYNAKIFFEVSTTHKVHMWFVRNDFRIAYLAEFSEMFRQHSSRLFVDIWES